MHELSPDELVSAYLDGELTPQEQARAESLLAGNAQARRMFDELRGMGSSLQDLPRQKLPSDFADGVLRAAQQRMLTASPAETTTAETAVAATGMERFRRPLAYIAIVLAASVLIAIFNPDAPRIDAPAPETIARAPADRPTRDLGREEAKGDDVPAIVAAPQPAMPTEEAPRRAGKLAEPPRESSYSDAPRLAKEATPPLGASQVRDEAVDYLNQQALDNSLLVVTCEITPGAAQQDAFRKVLTRNQISLEDARSAPPKEQQAQADNRPADDGEKAQARSDSGLELFYVEASPEQLEATLAEIVSQPKQFLSVDVGAPETRAVQNRWQDNYNRGRGGIAQQRVLDLQTATEGQRAAASKAAGGELASKPAVANGTTPGQVGKSAAPEDQAEFSNANPGRARAYSMPADGLASPRSNLQLQQRFGQEALATDRSKKQEPAPTAEKLAPPNNSNVAEQATLRALFVLRVADEQAAAAPAAATPSPAAKSVPAAKPGDK